MTADAAAGGPVAAALALEEVVLPPRFVPLAVLGAGGAGVVVRARDAALGRDVAVKVIARERVGDARSRDRFLREARAAGRLQHRHIVAVHDVDPGGRFIVMELVPGETLKQRIAREGALAPAEVRRVAAALLDALAAAHEAGIVHRDVKPANILGATGVVALGDFGIAGVADSELTATGERVGTPAYMAPEQLRGQPAGPRADLYAAGATLFEAATGERLHREGGEGPALGPRERVLAATGDGALADAIARALCERPEDRFADARELAAAIARAPARPPRRPGRGLAALAAGAALLLGGGSWWLARRGPAAADRELELGVAALERQDLAAATAHLEAAARAPDAPAVAHYRLAIAYWWTSRPSPLVEGAIDRALAGRLDERQRAFAGALRSLVALDYPAVIDRFRALAARYPDDREIQYGLFESLFHGGHPAEALAAHQRLRDRFPGFALGAGHAVACALSQGDLAAARRAAAAAGDDGALWRARILAAAGQPRDAVALLDRARSGWEIVALHALAGEEAAARDLARQLAAGDMRRAAFPLLALALARGEDTAAAWDLALSAAGVPDSPDVSSRDRWVDLAAFLAIDRTAPARAELVSRRLGWEPGHILEADVARAFLADAVGDQARLAELARSGFPEVAAIARAAAAERAGDHQAAALAWRQALAASAGRFRLAEAARLAAALARSGDPTGAAGACGEVRRPRLFHWSWGAAVARCRALSEGRRRP